MANNLKAEYRRFVIDLEEAADLALGHIEDCIDRQSISFYAFNPKTKKEEEVPVRNALNGLKYLCRRAERYFSQSEDETAELFLKTFRYLHDATRLMVFYFENKMFDNLEFEKEIMIKINTYYDVIDTGNKSLGYRFVTDIKQ